MGYGLLDDEDWDAWHRQQQNAEALGSLVPPDDFGGGYSPSPAAAQMPPVQLPGPDWTDALGVGTSALASLADLALNHGRNTGAILSAAGNYGAQRQDQRLKQSQDILSYETKRGELARQQQSDAQRQRYNDYLFANLARSTRQGDERIEQADKRIGISEQNAGVSKAREERAGRAEERNTNPESDYASRFAQMLYDTGIAEPGKYDGASFEQMKAAQPAEAKMFEYLHAREKARETAKGRVTGELDMAPETRAAAAAETAATTQSRIDTELANAPATRQAAADKAVAEQEAKRASERADSAGHRIANADIVDPEVVSRLNEKQLNDANDIARARVQFKTAVSDMEKAAARSGGFKVIPGKDKVSWQTAQAAAAAALTHLYETGTLQQFEFERYKAMLPGPDLTAGAAMGKTQESIRAARDVIMSVFDKGLSQYGYAPPKDTRMQRPGTAPPAAGPQPVAAEPGDGLGVSGGRKLSSIPTIPDQAPPREYTVSMPGQPTLRKLLDQNQVKALIAAHAEVIPVK